MVPPFYCCQTEKFISTVLPVLSASHWSILGLIFKSINIRKYFPQRKYFYIKTSLIFSIVLREDFKTKLKIFKLLMKIPQMNFFPLHFRQDVLMIYVMVLSCKIFFDLVFVASASATPYHISSLCICCCVWVCITMSAVSFGNNTTHSSTYFKVYLLHTSQYFTYFWNKKVQQIVWIPI